MRDGAITVFLGGEFFLLQFGIGSHAGMGVTTGKLEHSHVENVKTCESDKLKLVAHLAEFPLEICDACIVELFLPVERRRAVVGQKLAWKSRVDGVGEFPGLAEIRCGGFAPEHV